MSADDRRHETLSGLRRSAMLQRDILAESKPAEPVSMRGRVTSDGYRPENHQWLDQLLERDEHGKLVGRNPMDIDLDVLKNAGHPPRRTAALVAAWSDRGDESLFAPIREVRDIRTHCLECSAGGAREVRECRIINCPFWAYRLGRNPHNPRRGTRPAFGPKSSVTTELDEPNGSWAARGLAPGGDLDDARTGPRDATSSKALETPPARPGLRLATPVQAGEIRVDPSGATGGRLP
jgi:hypothetical protein